MSKHLVLIGGGHAHLTILKELAEIAARGHRVTLVAPEAYHYYSGMGPGLLGGRYRPAQLRFDVKGMTERGGGSFVEDTVVKIDAAQRRLQLASGEELGYDVASCNTGSIVPIEDLGAIGPGIWPVKPVGLLDQARRTIAATGRQRQTPLQLLVVGGGPAGVEIAGNLWRLIGRDGLAATVTLVAGAELLAGHPTRLRQRAALSLQRRGVTVLTGVRAESVRDGSARLSDGRTLPYDFALIATGIEPAPLYRDSGLPVGPDGGLLVNAFLQAPTHPELFGGGDCIHFAPQPLAKVGVYAVRQNPILSHNLLAALEGRPLRPFVPQSNYLLICNLGDDTGLLQKRGLVLAGRLAFRLKDWVDRAFMRRFQVCGERD